jgi:hypothetical protein
MKKKAILFAFVLFVLTGCNFLAPDDEPSMLASEYMPLSVGNRWYYSHLPTQTDGSTTITHIEEVIGTTPINGSTFYVLACKRLVQTDSFSVTGYIYLRCAGSKLIEGGINFGVFSTYTVADFSMQMGESWVMDQADMHYNVTVVEKDESKVTFYYDDPRMVDEEMMRTYQKGSGRISMRSLMWGGGDWLIRAELR